MTDVRKVLEFVKRKADVPVWMVGTSRGTVSVTAAAINMPDAMAGVVPTSSVVSYKKPGAVPKQDLAAVTVPVLVFHHSKDACIHCRPDEVPAAFKGFRNAPVKKLIFVDGGGKPNRGRVRWAALARVHRYGEGSGRYALGLDRESQALKCRAI